MAEEPNVQLATMLANLPEKTGKTLPEWRAILSQQAFEKHGQILKYLKGEYGVTHGFANLIAATFLASDDEEDLVEAQYAGPKSALRPLYETIVEYVITLGSDVSLTPKKSSVSVRRAKQFALITPASKSRIDLGLALKGEANTERLEPYNAMCSHRIRLESAADFDVETKQWLKLAFDRAG